MGAVSADPFQPVDLLDQVAVHGLAVSPTGTQLVYGRREISGSSYESRLFAVAFDGGREQALTAAGTQATAPSFSPDGTLLTFLSRHRAPGA